MTNGRAPLTASKFEAPPRDDAELNALNYNLGPRLRTGHALHLDRRPVEPPGRLRRLLRADDRAAGQEEEETDDDAVEQ